MRLAEFILTNTEPILLEWEAFARGIQPGSKMEPLALRDHAGEILGATVRDMASAQSAAQQSDKSRGRRPHGDATRQKGHVRDEVPHVTPRAIERETIHASLEAIVDAVLDEIHFSAAAPILRKA